MIFNKLPLQGAYTINLEKNEDKRGFFARSFCLEEFEKLINSIDEDELTKGKQMVKGHILLSSEDSRSISSWLGSQELLLGEITSIEETIKQIDMVTVDDIRKTGEKLFRPDKATIAAVGPFTKDTFKDLIL